MEKRIFFFAVLAVYLVSAVATLLGVIGVLTISPGIMKILVSGIIVATAGALLGLAKKTDFFSGGKEMFKLPDYKIDGEWDYVCQSVDGSGYEHGGKCRITRRHSAYGFAWSLAGERTWLRPSPDTKPAPLTPPIFWETTWAAITDEDSLRFTYKIGDVEGYAFANIETNRKKQITSFRGHFYQLPPKDPKHGNIIFRRKSTSSSD